MDMALHSSNNLYCLQKHDKNIKGVKWFGYLHCGIGLTSILLGAVSILILRNAEAAICILFGAWIAITGVDGIFSAKEPTKKILNQRYFAFSLACITMCLVAIGLCIFGFIKYNECQHLQHGCSRKEEIGFILHLILTTLMVVEFLTSHVTVVLSFQRECHCEYCVFTLNNTTSLQDLIVQEVFPPPYEELVTNPAPAIQEGDHAIIVNGMQCLP